MNRKQFLGLVAGAAFCTLLPVSAKPSKTSKSVTLAIAGMSWPSGWGGRVSDALSRLDGVTQVKMNGKKADVTYDTAKTTQKKLIEAFNSSGGRYKASVSK